MEKIVEFLERWDLLGFVIAAVISLLVGLIYKGIKNFVTMKRKAYNISRQTTSRTVYENRKDGDFCIEVSYKGRIYEGPLTLLRLRLLNDGENDINYIRQCAKPITIEVASADIVDVYVEPSSNEIGTTFIKEDENTYDLAWTLFKKDEYIDIVFVAKGKDFQPEQVKMKVRAEGIDKIKSPEYRVWPKLWPSSLAIILFALVVWLFMPAEITFIPYIPQNLFWAGIMILMLPLNVIAVLVNRIRWEKE